MAPALAAVRKKRRRPADADAQAEVRLHSVEPGAAAGTPLFLRGEVDCCEVCEAVAEAAAEETAAAVEEINDRAAEPEPPPPVAGPTAPAAPKKEEEPEEAAEPAPEEEEEPEAEEEAEEEAGAGPVPEEDQAAAEAEAAPEVEGEAEEEQMAAPGGIQTMDDLQAAVQQKTAAIPQPRVKSGGPAAAAVDDAAKKARERLQLVAGRVPVEAKAAEPGPRPLPPLPEPTPEDPVPQAGRRVEEASGKPLEKVVPPPLVKSPRGNIPKLGDRPVSAEDFRRLRNVQEELPFPPDTEQEKTRKELLKRREEMLKPTDPKEQPGEPLPIPLTAPAEPLPLPPDLALEPAKVFARLLAEPDKAADDLLGDARKGLYPDGIVQEVLPDLGSSFKAELTATLDARLRELADKGGVTVADLNQEISHRQAVLREGAVSSQEEILECSVDAASQVSQAGEEARDAAASQALTLATESQDAVAAVSQGIDTLPIETRRDTLISTISRRVALADLAYDGAGTERRSDLDSSERGYVAAYQAVAQRDELQLLERRPEGADDVRIRELTIESQTWRDARIDDVRKAFEGLRTRAKTEVETLRGDLLKAGGTAREEIRDWAASQTGQVRTDWDRLVDQTQDWAAQLMESARAIKEKTDRETAATVNENLVLLDRLKKAADEGVQEEELLRHNQLSAEQRAIVTAFFESRRSGKAFDPIEAVATGLRAKVLDEKRGELNARLETQMYEVADWKQLEKIGNAGGAGVDIAKKAHDIHEGVHGGLFGSNEPEKVMGALTGGLNKPHMEALKKKYLEYGEGSLEADLADQLSKGEWKRAQGLMSNDKGTAVSAELYTAMKEGFLGTGLGTDEKTIMKALRGLSAKERDDVIAAYQRDFGRDLRKDLKGELDDWATETKHDVERAEALLDLNVAKADAIAVDQALYTSSGSDRREGVAAVYDQVRTEVDEQAKREGWTPAQREAEITRRSRLIEKEYDQKYAETKVLVPGPDGHLQEVRHGSLRESFNKKVYAQEEKDLLHAYADNKRDAIDAAKIRIERTSTYTGDTAVLDVLGAQQDRALEDARAEIGPQKRQARLRELAIAEEEAKKAGKPWTPEERFRRQKLMEQAVEADIVAAAQVKSKQYMDKLQDTYQSTYKESVSTVVKEGLSTGNNQKEAETLLARGYLTPYEQLKYAVEGAGTREEMGKKALRGKTKAQIAEIKAQWELEHPGEPFTEALDDFSGDDRTEVEISVMGTPETIDDVLAIEQKKVAIQRPTNSFASGLAGVELKDMEDRLKDLEETHRKIKSAGSDMSVEDQKRLLGQYDFQAQATSAAVESHRESVAAVTESIANVASITVALVIGFGGAIFTGGASAALALAVIASIAATATSIGTRALLLGSSYGSEELWTDIGMGAIDAVVSGLTAGLGGRLLGLRQVAAGAVKKQGQNVIRQAITKQLARLGNVGRVTRGVKPIAFLEKMAAKEAAWYSRFAAEAISESIENTVQSLPSALVSTAMDERTWEKGNPLANLVSGVGGQLGQGLVMGLAVGHATKLATGAVDLIKGPRLGAETHLTPPAEMTPAERSAHLKEYMEMYPGKTEADFDATIQRERAAATKAAEEQAAYRDKVREELKGSPDAGAAAGEVPITVLDPVEFHRLQGLKGGGDAMVVVRDGQVHLVVKQGADPAVVKQHAAKVDELAEPGTGGRSKNPADSLPRDLRGKVDVKVNEKLEGASVRVHYDHDPATGLITNVRVEVGPNARAVDIHNHVQTVRTMRSYADLSGKVRKLLGQLNELIGRKGGLKPGDPEFEADLELRKLPKVIDERMAALQQAKPDSEEAIQIELELEHLQAQVAKHKATLETGEGEARGYVAADMLSPKALKERYQTLSKKYPELQALAADDPVLLRLLTRPQNLEIFHQAGKLGDYIQAVKRLYGLPVADTHVHAPGLISPEDMVRWLMQKATRADAKGISFKEGLPEIQAGIKALIDTSPLDTSARKAFKTELDAFVKELKALEKAQAKAKGAKEAEAIQKQIKDLEYTADRIIAKLEDLVSLKVKPDQATPLTTEFFTAFAQGYSAVYGLKVGPELVGMALKRMTERGVALEIRQGFSDELISVIQQHPDAALGLIVTQVRRWGGVEAFVRRVGAEADIRVLGPDLSGKEQKLKLELLTPSVRTVADHNFKILSGHFQADPELAAAAHKKLKELRTRPEFEQELKKILARAGLAADADIDPVKLAQALHQRLGTSPHAVGDMALLNHVLRETILDVDAAAGKGSRLGTGGKNALQGVTVHGGEQVMKVALPKLLDDVGIILDVGADRVGHGVILGMPLVDNTGKPNFSVLEQLGFKLQEDGSWQRQRGTSYGTRETYTLADLQKLDKQRRDLLARAEARGTVIEINPASNLVLSKLDPLNHPVRHMLKDAPGLRVSANTDNPGIHLTDASSELAFLHATGVLTWPQTVRAGLEGYSSRLGSRPLAQAEDLRLRAREAIVRGTPATERIAVLKELAARYPGVPRPETGIDVNTDDGFRKALEPYLKHVFQRGK